MLTLFEAGFLSATDPAVKLPQVCYRLLSERFEMQVTVRSKLWGHGRADKAPALHLCQNIVPPPFMSSQSVRIFRRPWIRDLGALIIADPRVDMAVEQWPRILEFLRQDMYQPVGIERSYADLKQLVTQFSGQPATAAPIMRQ